MNSRATKNSVVIRAGLGWDESLRADMRIEIAALLDEFFLGAQVTSPSRKDAAKALHMSDRTLSRRLQKAGTTYKNELQRFRIARAFQHLETGVSVKWIAYSMGFRDPSAFSHAFKRWTGQSASDYRRSNEIKGVRTTWLERPAEFRVAFFRVLVNDNNSQVPDSCCGAPLASIK